METQTIQRLREIDKKYLMVNCPHCQRRISPSFILNRITYQIKPTNLRSLKEIRLKLAKTKDRARRYKELGDDRLYYASKRVSMILAWILGEPLHHSWAKRQEVRTRCNNCKEYFPRPKSNHSGLCYSCFAKEYRKRDYVKEKKSIYDKKRYSKLKQKRGLNPPQP